MRVQQFSSFYDFRSVRDMINVLFFSTARFFLCISWRVSFLYVTANVRSGCCHRGVIVNSAFQSAAGEQLRWGGEPVLLSPHLLTTTLERSGCQQRTFSNAPRVVSLELGVKAYPNYVYAGARAKLQRLCEKPSRSVL